MKTSITRITKKGAAVTLALAIALSVSPMIKSDAKAKVKAPTISPKTVVIVKGKTKTLKVKKGTYKIKSVKWTSKNQKIATVNKKGKVTAKNYGKAKIQAVVTTKKSAKKTKKYKIYRWVEVIEDGESNEPDIPQDTWILPNPTIKEGHTGLFDAVNSCIDGVSYTPLSVIGFNNGSDATSHWRFLARQTTPGAEASYVLIQIAENGDQVTVEKIVETGLSAYAAATEPTAGGWQECAPEFSTEELDKIYSQLNPEALSGYSVTPIAKIASQVVGGGDVNCKIIAQGAAVVLQPIPTYIIADITIKADGTVTYDATSAISFSLDDKTGDDSRGTSRNTVLKGYEGVTIQDIWIDKIGGTTWNFGAVFFNATDEYIALDTSKFEFEKEDGSKYKLIPTTWKLPKYQSYIRWATSGLSKDFIAALNVGDKITVYYDGEKLDEITTSHWP